MILSIFFQLVGYVIIIKTNSLHMAYVALIILGATFPGKHVVVYNYVLEQCPKSYKANLITLCLGIETTIVVVAITAYYQFITKNHVY